jgi:hypothetical protein
MAPSEERQHHIAQQAAAAAAAAQRRASVKLPQLLTNQISAATALSQLHDVIASYGNRLSHFHVAKLLTRTSQLASAAAAGDTSTAVSASGHCTHEQQQQQLLMQQQGEQLQLLFSRLTEMMSQRARHTTVETLVAAVAAIGRLNTLSATTDRSVSSAAAAGAAFAAASRQQQLQLLASRAIELRHDLSISQASALLWGFAKAGLNPGPGWMDSMVEAALQAYQQQQQAQQQQQQQAQTQQQEQTQQQPSTLNQQLLPRPSLPAQQHRQQQRQPQLTVSLHQKRRQTRPQQHSLATDLALTVYAAAVMGQQLQQQVLEQWQAAVLQQLPAANAQDLSQMLWGLGALRQNPGGQLWLHQVLLAFADKLDG